jgi:hypothetical protein
MSRHPGEPRLAAVGSWAVLGAAFGLSASTWIALARLAGLTGRSGIGSATVDLAWLMPVAVDGHLVVSLVLWLAPVAERVRHFAKVNTYGAAGVGIVAQSAYHLAMTATGVGVPGWRTAMAAAVGALPPTVAALAVHMRALLRHERLAAGTPRHAIDDAAPDTVASPMAHAIEDATGEAAMGTPLRHANGADLRKRVAYAMADPGPLAQQIQALGSSRLASVPPLADQHAIEDGSAATPLVRHATPPPRRGVRQDTAARVAAWHNANPNGTDADAAEALAIGVRTVSRHRAPLRKETA